MDTSRRSPKTPLTEAQFECLRQDPAWRLTQLQFNAFAATHAASLAEPGDAFHYVIRRTGRSSHPYLLQGPLLGVPSSEVVANS
jgi:hypothetical protein